MRFEPSVVVCAHNEEFYIEGCLKSIRDQTVVSKQLIIVLDRCTDRTGALSRSLLDSECALVIEKDSAKWRNSISENLELAREKATGDALVVVDADMVVSPRFLELLLPQLKEFASVSAIARTDPAPGILNRLVSVWERTYAFTPLGEQPRGGARVISKTCLDSIGGFRDVFAWDTDLDARFRAAGFQVKLDRNLTVLHRRKMTLRRSVGYQIKSGTARRELGGSFTRTLLHSIVRLRPFVIYGYLKETLGSRSKYPEAR